MSSKVRSKSTQQNKSKASTGTSQTSKWPDTKHPNTQVTNVSTTPRVDQVARKTKSKRKTAAPSKTKPKKKVSIKLPYRKLDSSSSDDSLTFPLRRRNNIIISSRTRDNQSSRFIPAALSGFSDTRMTFKTAKHRLGATKSTHNWQSRVHVFDAEEPVNAGSEIHKIHFDPHDPRRDVDAVNEAKRLKSKLLAGERVSLQQIEDVKFKMLAEEQEGTRKTVRKVRRIQDDTQVVQRRKLYCVKGIIHIPTPHRPYIPYNTFGSPADLRISLSNQDTPEYQGRRRLFFDFSEFNDDEIQISLEVHRKLIIEAKKDPKVTPNTDPRFHVKLTPPEPILSRTEIIELPRDLEVDNLRIVRDAFGTLIVEEAWKFN